MTEEEINSAMLQLSRLRGSVKKRTTEEKYERIREKIAEQICKKFK